MAGIHVQSRQRACSHAKEVSMNRSSWLLSASSLLLSGHCSKCEEAGSMALLLTPSAPPLRESK
jgi:hypothetical protein